MGKVKVYSIDPKEKRRITNEFFDLIVNLKSKDEVFNFLIGFLTSSEILMISRRLQIARLLIEENTYDIIRKKMRVSYLTISSIEHWLNKDENKKLLISEKIKMLKKDEKNKIIKDRSFSYGLLNKYHNHRRIFG